MVQPVQFLQANVVHPIANGAGGFDNNTYANIKSATQGLLNGSILLGNVFLVISLNVLNKDADVQLYAATTTFLCISIAFEFVNLILAVILFTFTQGSTTSVWFTFWALILSLLGLIVNGIASYLVSISAPELVSKMGNGTSG